MRHWSMCGFAMKAVQYKPAYTPTRQLFVIGENYKTPALFIQIRECDDVHDNVPRHCSEVEAIRHASW